MEKLLSAAQVADHLGMHVKTLYKLVRNNEIALNFERIHGRTIAFKPSEVERFLSLREIRRDGAGAKKKATNLSQVARKKNLTKSAKEVAGYTATVFLTNIEAQEFFKRLVRR
jgi:excisionase family DNA binding protein